MIAFDNTREFREQFANSIEYEEVGPKAIQVSTPLTYDDGDHWGFLLKQISDAWFLCDEGEVLTKATYKGVNLLAKGHRNRLQDILKLHGVEERNGQLLLPIREDFGASFFAFARACLDVEQLAKLPIEQAATAKKRGGFKVKIASVFADVKNRATVVEDWHHPEYDPHGVYGVDYLVEAPKESLLVFTVGSESETLKAAVSAMHYRQRHLPFVGIAVTDESRTLNERSRTVLDDAFAVKFPSDDTDGLREFLKSKLAA